MMFPEENQNSSLCFKQNKGIKDETKEKKKYKKTIN